MCLTVAAVTVGWRFRVCLSEFLACFFCLRVGPYSRSSIVEASEGLLTTVPVQVHCIGPTSSPRFSAALSLFPQ